MTAKDNDKNKENVSETETTVVPGLVNDPKRPTFTANEDGTSSDIF